MGISIDNHPNQLIQDVKLIRLNGVGIGYCGIVEGSPICFTSVQPDSVKAAVVKTVSDYFKGAVGSVNQPPACEDEEIESDESDTTEV
tara:strand:- start:3648 stop:3911 length:264 start_codon:yes stop_codon:yes gene_type:complete